MNISSQMNYPESIDPERASPSAECNETRFNAIIDQKNSLFKHIDEVLDSIPLEEDASKKIINARELRQSIEDFQDFFKDYFKFFENGDKTEYQKKMSCECVLSQALAQINSIWTSLSWAVNQRFMSIHEEKLKKLNADIGELMGLAPELFSVGNKRPPIVYFDKFIRITRYTYPTSPLIGVSIDKTPEEWRLSLAHELGHYVFWHSGNLQEYSKNIDAIHNMVFLELEFNKTEGHDHNKIINSTKTKLEMFEILKGWSEEMLADIFATLLIGPEYAKSCQDILARDSISNTDDHIKNDGRHPIPKLRPLISLEVLKIIAKKKKDEGADSVFLKSLGEVISNLSSRWGRFTELNTDIHLKNMPDCKIEELSTHLLNIVTKVTLSSKENYIEDYKPLIDRVLHYWGSTETLEKEMDDLRKIVHDLRKDFLGKTPTPSMEKTNREEGNGLDNSEYNDSFNAFLKYVRDQESENPVWKDMLSLNLTQTEYSYCIKYNWWWQKIGDCTCR